MKHLVGASAAAIGSLGAVVILATVAFAGTTSQTANEVQNQSGGGELLAENAVLKRQPNSISINVMMETPASGEYNYPEGAVEGSPEIFTGWAFVFNHPEYCTDPCGMDDLANADVEVSVYNFAGHVKGQGGYLNLSGHISVGETPFQAPFPVYPLSNPAGAVVHVAIAPHGQLDPATLPGELRTPVGNPLCDCWWVAIFNP